MPRILVLSGSNRETQAYAKHLGVRPTAVQHAFGANNVRGVTLSEIHELPSFSSRRDRHAILAALRYLRQYGRSNRQLEHKTVDWEYVRPAAQIEGERLTPCPVCKGEIAHHAACPRPVLGLPIEGELPGQTTIDDFIDETPGVPPPPPEVQDVAPTKAPTKPRQKRAAKKATPAPKPKSGSNALEPSSVDAFFRGS